LRPLVLIVDGHDDTCEVYVEGLSALGFETMGVDGCAEACRRAWQAHPDIIVAVPALRDGDVCDLLQQLKDEARTRDIPVVVLTPHAEQSFRERAEAEGYGGVFIKPCLPDELAIELRHLLDRSTAMNASRHSTDGDRTMPTPRRRGKDREPSNQFAGTPATVPTATGNVPNTVESLASEPTHDDIARRAYQLYAERGGEHGLDWNDWFQAERELRQQVAQERADILSRIGSEYAVA
jgi:CheY-like chemotaxis protein